MREWGVERAIVPLGMVADRAWHASSWDRFTVPKPRARVVIAFGEPIHVGRDTDDQQRLAKQVEDVEYRPAFHIAGKRDELADRRRDRGRIVAAA